MIFAFAIFLVFLRVFYLIGEMYFERDWPRSTWRGLVTALGLMLLCASAFGQAIRVDQPIQTSGPNVPSSGGPLPQALWVANATVILCTHPSATFSTCQANPIVTYTDSTQATTCPATTPLVLLPGSTCSASAGSTADVGFWYAGGTVDYFVTSSYGTFGPFTVSNSVGGGGGGGSPAAPLGVEQTYKSSTTFGPGINVDCTNGLYSNNAACVTAAAAASYGVVIPANSTGGIAPQYAAVPAKATCSVNPFAGTIAVNPSSLGYGYLTAPTVTVNTSSQPGAGPITVTANLTGSQVTSYTVGGTNAGFGPGSFGNGTICPFTFVVGAPPTPTAVTPVVDQRDGPTSYTPTVPIDIFGCHHDGVTDDSACYQQAIAWCHARSGQCHVSLTSGYTYYINAINGYFNGAGDDGSAPNTAQATCSASSGVMGGSCTVTTAGSKLGTAYITNLGGGTGGSCTPTVTSGALTSMTCTGGTGYSNSFTVYVGATCQSSQGQYLCTNIAPSTLAQIPMAVDLQNGYITFDGNGATILGPFGISSNPTIPAISSYSCTSNVCTFQTDSTAPSQVVLEGFPITQALNGQMVTTSSVSSTQFTATVTGVGTASNTEPGFASPYVNSGIYQAMFGSSNGQGSSNVIFNNVNFQNFFIALANPGSSSQLNNVNFINGGQAVYGNNMQFLLGNSLNNVNSYGGVYCGGTSLTRYFGVGGGTESLGNSNNLCDGGTFQQGTFNSGTNATSILQWNKQREAWDCYWDQNFFRVEDQLGPNGNSTEYCYYPPNGLPRQVDQTITLNSPPDDQWRGNYGVMFNISSRYGRAISGYQFSNWQMRSAPSYAVNIGVAGSYITGGSGSERTGVCTVVYGGSYVTYAIGSSQCPNVFEPQYTTAPAMFLDGTTGAAWSGIAEGYQNLVTHPWQVNGSYNSPTASGTVINGVAQAVSTPPTNTVSPSGNFQAYGYTPPPNSYQSGSKIGSDSVYTIMEGSKVYYQGVINYLENDLWRLAVRDQVYSNTYPSVFEITDNQCSSSSGVLCNQKVKIPGLSVNSSEMAGGQVTYFTVTNVGTLYPNAPVVCGVGASPQSIVNAGTVYYQSDCQAVPSTSGTIPNGNVTNTSNRKGVGYLTAPPVVIAPPGAAIFQCNPVSSTCTQIQPGLGLTNTTVGEFPNAGSGASYTPGSIVNGNVATLTVSGGTLYTNPYFVYVGSNGGTQATATATISAIDPLAYIEHFDGCTFVPNIGTVGTTVSIPANTLWTIPTVTCAGAKYLTGTNSSKGDFIHVQPAAAIIGNTGASLLDFYAQPTAANTITLYIGNKTTNAITLAVGNLTNPWFAIPASGNTHGDQSVTAQTGGTLVTTTYTGGSGSGSVLVAPSATQTVAQPIVAGAQTQLNVNALNGDLNVSQFSGSSTAARTLTAQASLPTLTGTDASTALVGEGLIPSTETPYNISTNPMPTTLGQGFHLRDFRATVLSGWPAGGELESDGSDECAKNYYYLPWRAFHYTCNFLHLSNYASNTFGTNGFSAAQIIDGTGPSSTIQANDGLSAYIWMKQGTNTSTTRTFTTGGELEAIIQGTASNGTSVGTHMDLYNPRSTTWNTYSVDNPDLTNISIGAIFEATAQQLATPLDAASPWHVGLAEGVRAEPPGYLQSKMLLTGIATLTNSNNTVAYVSGDYFNNFSMINQPLFLCPTAGVDCAGIGATPYTMNVTNTPTTGTLITTFSGTSGNYYWYHFGGQYSLYAQGSPWFDLSGSGPPTPLDPRGGGGAIFDTALTSCIGGDPKGCEISIRNPNLAAVKSDGTFPLMSIALDNTGDLLYYTPCTASFTASIATSSGVTTMTVTGTPSPANCPLAVGMTVTPPGTGYGFNRYGIISALGTGTGGAGTYILLYNSGATTSSTSMVGLGQINGAALAVNSSTQLFHFTVSDGFTGTGNSELGALTLDTSLLNNGESDLKGQVNLWSGNLNFYQQVSNPATANRVFTLPDANTNSVQPISASSGNCVQYIDNAGVQHLASCSGGITGLTTGYIPTAASATTLANSHMDDGVTTAATITATETFAAPKIQGTGSNPLIQTGLYEIIVGSPIASATTITPGYAAIFHVTGTTAIATITPPGTMSSTVGGCLQIVPDGAFTTTTAGNIGLASTAVVGKVLTECYDGSKWYPSY